MSATAQRFVGHFDLVVVGGGIQGACIAALAARNGWKTVLVEQNDFGSGASANSLKVIHGGLRYLQHLDFQRMRESIAARSLLLRMAPGLVKPGGFVMPLKGFGLRSPPALAAALAINEWISRRRNDGLSPECRIPAAHLISSRELNRLFPGVSLPPHRGGALWYDGLAVDTERLTLAFVLDAERHGAVVANYTRATRLLKEGGRVTGVEVECLSSTEHAEVSARHVLWAGGGNWAKLATPEGNGRDAGSWVRAINLVLDVPWNSPFGLAYPSIGTGRERRNFFFVPWRNRLMVGTWYQPVKFTTDAGQLRPDEIDALLSEVRTCLPEKMRPAAKVSMVHCGILPSMGPGSVTPARAITWRHGIRDGVPGGFSVVQAVKYTTAPMIAAWSLSRIGKELALPLRRPTWNQPLQDALPAREAWDETDVRRAVEKEHARHLDDLVLRRLAIGSAAIPTVAELNRAAVVMAATCGWDVPRMEMEVRRVREHYARLGLESGR